MYGCRDLTFTRVCVCVCVCPQIAAELRGTIEGAFGPMGPEFESPRVEPVRPSTPPLDALAVPLLSPQAV